MTSGGLVGRPAGCVFFQHHKHDECQTQCSLLVGHSVTMTIFQGRSSVKQFQLKVLCACPIKLELCVIAVD